ncbi:hypothetical protein KI387_024189, partial [Taxus chinensis]
MNLSRARKSKEEFVFCPTKKMAPKKATVSLKKGKGKGKQRAATSFNEEWYVEMQYLDGVFLRKEWVSHVRKMAMSDYNHHIGTIEKEMALELVHPTNKWTQEGMPIYNDEVKVKLEKAKLLQ